MTAPPTRRRDISKRIPARNESARLRAAIGIAIVVATFLLYFQVRGHQFCHLDDQDYVTENAHVKAGLTWSGIKWSLTTFHSANWHPLTWWSHMLDCELFGVRAGSHKLVNVLLHTATSILLFHLLARMTLAVWLSWLVAMLFAIHPLHVESVAWVAERKDVLSAFFGLLTLHAYVSYIAAPGGGRYALLAFLLSLGLMAKPMLVTLPCVMLLLDYWPLSRFATGSPSPGQPGRTFARLLVEKLPLFALVATSSVITFKAQSAGGAVVSTEVLPLATRIGNAMASYVSYLVKTFYPINLGVFYPHSFRSPGVWDVAAPGAILLVVTAAAFHWRVKRPYFLVGWLWYVGTLVPVIGLVQVGHQAMTDRYTYIPLVGVFIMIAWGLADVASALRLKFARAPHWIGGAVALFLIVLGVLTHRQIGYWRNTDSLFGRAIDVTGGKADVHELRAQNYIKAGRWDEAILEFREVVKMRPEDPSSFFNLGLALYHAGRIAEGVVQFHESLQQKPDHAGAHFWLSDYHLNSGEWEKSLYHAALALQGDPRLLYVHHDLGTALSELGRHDEAIPHLREWLTHNDEAMDTRMYLVRSLVALKRMSEAETELTAILAHDPAHAEALAVQSALQNPARNGDDP